VRVWKPDAALKHPISLLIPNLPSCLSYLIHDYTTGTSQWAWLSVGLRQALDRHSKMFPTAKSFILNIRRAPRNRFKKPILITFTPTSEEYPRAARQVNTSLAHLQHVETRE
jgi:hypothetical protein